MGSQATFAISGIIATVVILFYNTFVVHLTPPNFEDEYWGSSSQPKIEEPSVKLFQIKIDENVSSVLIILAYL